MNPFFFCQDAGFIRVNTIRRVKMVLLFMSVSMSDAIRVRRSSGFRE